MEPTHMAASRGTSPGTGRPWSSLPDDLLGMILARLDSSLDHVRFAIVCTSWRAVLLTRPPRRVHPWLLLDPHRVGETKRAYCPGDRTIVPLASLHGFGETRGKCFVGSHPGGWVAYEAPLRVINIFSGAEAALPPPDQGRGVATRKVIFSESPNSSGCILAAITDKNEVVICCLGSPEGGWTTRKFIGKPVVDIAFCNGHLYCIVQNSKGITKFEIGLDKYGVPVISAVHWLSIKDKWTYFVGSMGDPDAHSRYIVEMGEKLVMVVRGPRLRRNCGSYFMLFELVDVEMEQGTTQQFHSWKKVTSLGDHALLLGPSCSKAVHIPTSGHGGLQRNHIYYTHHRCYTHKNHVLEEAQEFFMSSNDRRVYYKIDEITSYYVDYCTSVGYYVVGGAHPPMWLFPPHV